jgi:tRNA nucleotidyltransferase/poly(A) polymerase
MEPMAQRFEPVLKTLNEAGVRYLVVGGVAVVLHGYLRTTGDLDLVVELSPANLDRALAALKKASGRAQDLEDIEALEDLARGAGDD